MSDNTELDDLRDDADDLEQGIVALIALGGIATNDGAKVPIAELHKAHTAIASNQPAEARDAILNGQAALERLIDERKWWWRIVNVHQLPLFIYHVVWFFILIAMGTTCAKNSEWCVIPATLLGDMVPTAAIVAGALGAELRGIWFLWNQTSRRIYHRRFLLGQLAAPFTGVLLGMLTYLLAKAGLFAIGGDSAKAHDGTAAFGELALCFFVGFKWEWALERIQSIFVKTDAPSEPSPKEE